MCERRSTHTVKRMKTATPFFGGFLNDESGVTAIEYALLGALIAVVIVGAVGATGTSLLGLYTSVAAKISAALGGLP